MNVRTTIDFSCPLTRGELQCIDLLSKGKTPDEIAVVVHRAKCTVDNRLRRARQAARARTSIELVAKALREGWIE